MTLQIKTDTALLVLRRSKCEGRLYFVSYVTVTTKQKTTHAIFLVTMCEYILRQFSPALITAMVTVESRKEIIAHLSHNHANFARFHRNAQATLVTCQLTSG